MSDYDPNRMDPTRSDQARYNSAPNFSWNWIIGGIAALVVLIVALSFVGRNDQTADTGKPAATTGQSTPSTSPAPSMPPAQRAPSPNQ